MNPNFRRDGPTLPFRRPGDGGTPSAPVSTSNGSFTGTGGSFAGIPASAGAGQGSNGSFVKDGSGPHPAASGPTAIFEEKHHAPAPTGAEECTSTNTTGTDTTPGTLASNRTSAANTNATAAAVAAAAANGEDVAAAPPLMENSHRASSVDPEKSGAGNGHASVAPESGTAGSNAATDSTYEVSETTEASLMPRLPTNTSGTGVDLRSTEELHAASKRQSQLSDTKLSETNNHNGAMAAVTDNADVHERDDVEAAAGNAVRVKDPHSPTRNPSVCAAGANGSPRSAGRPGEGLMRARSTDDADMSGQTTMSPRMMVFTEPTGSGCPDDDGSESCSYSASIGRQRSKKQSQGFDFPASPGSDERGLEEGYGGVEGYIHDNISYKGAVAELIRQAAPAAFAQLLSHVSPTLTTGFVGQRLGFEALAAYSVGVSVFNVCGMTFCQGLIFGLDTLAPQLYGSRAGGVAMGTLLHRALVLTTFLASILGFVFIGLSMSGALDAMFGHSLGSAVGMFLSLSFPNMLIQVTANVFRRMLRAEKIQDIPVYACLVSLIACPIANYYLCFSLPMTVVVLTICSITEMVVMVIWAMLDSRVSFARRNYLDPDTLEPVYTTWWSKCWFLCSPNFRRDVLDWDQVSQFLHLSLPSLGSVMATWWAYEAFMFFASQVGELEVSAYAINTRMMLILYAIHAGLGTACATLVGNALGADEPNKAKKLAMISVGMSSCLVIFDSLALFFGSDYICPLYTSDPRLLAVLHKFRWGVSLVHLGDSVQVVLQGIYRAAGEQKTSLKVIVMAMWFLAIPAATFFVFGSPHLGLAGIYLASLTGMTAMVPRLFLGIRHWDWQELADNAQERSRSMSCTPASVAPSVGGRGLGGKA